MLCVESEGCSRTGTQTPNNQQVHKDGRQSEQVHLSVEPAVSLKGRGRGEAVRGSPMNMEQELRELIDRKSVV